MLKKLLAFLIFIGILYALWSNGEIKREYGILVEEAPYQKDLGASGFFIVDDYTIRKMAEFRITARVLGVKRYRRGREADLSNYDLALGWGPMSDTGVLNEIKISQRNRWYYWKVREFPIPRREIETNSANMHLLTRDPYIKKELGRVKRGHIVEIAGYLVYVNASDGWRWRSSLTRTDTGAGSCEVIWVEDFRIVE